MGEETEEICVQRFLDWYNEQHKRNYTYERAESCFPGLKGRIRWEFVVHERDNLEHWVGIEVKELPTLQELYKQVSFWQGLCSDLTRSLANGGIHGEFKVDAPNLRLTNRQEFLKVLAEILCEKAPRIRVSEEIEIGYDIAQRFCSWPREGIASMEEYEKWGDSRPAKLSITKTSDSGCKVSLRIGPTIGPRYVPTMNERASKQLNIKRANQQLKRARAKGAKETILLLACPVLINVDENLIGNLVGDWGQLISDIDFIYLVGMGSENRVVKIYPDSG
jgi:hypothetical protein